MTVWDQVNEFLLGATESCQQGLEYTDCIPCRGVNTPHKGFPGYDIKIYFKQKSGTGSNMAN